MVVMMIILCFSLRAKKEAVEPEKNGLYITNSTFTRNRKQAIFIDKIFRSDTEKVNLVDYQTQYVKKDAEIRGTSFIGCSVFGTFFNNAAGAALFAAGANVGIHNCKLTGNIARYGGAVCAYDSILKISDCCFEQNRALNYSGALWSMAYEKDGAALPQIETKLFISGTDFINNTADEYYGALCANYTNPEIYKCNFYYNSANDVGAIGLICWYQAKLTNVEIVNNRCLNNGCPALWIQGRMDSIASNYKFNNLVFLNNTNGEENKLADRKSVV